MGAQALGICTQCYIIKNNFGIYTNPLGYLRVSKPEFVFSWTTIERLVFSLLQDYVIDCSAIWVNMLLYLLHMKSIFIHRYFNFSLQFKILVYATDTGWTNMIQIISTIFSME